MYRHSLGELNARIAAARSAIDRRRQLARMQRAIDSERTELSLVLAELSAAMERDRKELDRLEGTSLSSMLHALLGDREARLDRERRQWMVTRLRYQETRRALEAAGRRHTEIAAELDQLAGAERALDTLLEEKARWLGQSGGPVAEELLALAEEAGRLKALIAGIDHVLERGGSAQAELSRVVTLLQEAEDMPATRLAEPMAGPGHTKLEAAAAQIEPAQIALAHFERELVVVLAHVDTSMKPGLAQVLEHARTQPRRYFEQIIDTLIAHLEALQHQRAELCARLDDVEARRRDLLERWK